ncbi:MAG: cysteine--tRNA ligase [Pirellulaceae bacterium]|nr:cysteine--tRNA ligase [Pirellulaceae bacterium]
MTIQIYNTLSGQKEPFIPVVEGKVGIYLCGPTVYAESHIGHMVGPVIFDAIKRYLSYSGYDVTWVVNITDVDDKLIHKANERGITMEQVAQEMIADYLGNLQSLGVDQIDHMPKATDHIDHIIDFIQTLIDKGAAYPSEGDVFFDVTKCQDYGKLSNRNLDDMRGEGGGAAGKKRSLADFALWKGAKEGEPSWESPWGKGRPGWHIECSAMSHAILGKTFDIHGGGLDLAFPHHENEIAQSESCHHQPMAKYWMHNGLMRAESAGKVGGKSDRTDEATDEEKVKAKISRSAGAGGLHKLIDELGGEKLRFFLLRTHYRSTIIFGQEAVAEAGSSLDTFYHLFERFERITNQNFYGLPIQAKRETKTEHSPALASINTLRNRYLQQMDDDFNTGGAIGNLFEIVKQLNKFADQNQLEETDSPQPEIVETFVQGTLVLRELTAILGLFLKPATKREDTDGLTNKLMDLIIDLRTVARDEKNWAIADRIRDGLTDMNITLEDRKGGTIWRVSS